MNLKKIAITLLVTILCISSVNAEKMSRVFIAVLQSNGHWEYQPVSVANSESVWVRIINPKNGCEHKQTWNLNPKAWRQPGNTSLKIEDIQDFYEETHRFTSDFAINIESNFLENHADYVVNGCLVAVWHYNDFSGVGYLFQILMSEGVTEKYCVESFLNKERACIKEVCK